MDKNVVLALENARNSVCSRMFPSLAALLQRYCDESSFSNLSTVLTVLMGYELCSLTISNVSISLFKFFWPNLLIDFLIEEKKKFESRELLCFWKTVPWVMNHILNMFAYSLNFCVNSKYFVKPHQTLKQLTKQIVLFLYPPYIVLSYF